MEMEQSFTVHKYIKRIAFDCSSDESSYTEAITRVRAIFSTVLFIRTVP